MFFRLPFIISSAFCSAAVGAALFAVAAAVLSFSVLAELLLVFLLMLVSDFVLLVEDVFVSDVSRAGFWLTHEQSESVNVRASAITADLFIIIVTLFLYVRQDFCNYFWVSIV